MNLRIVGQNLLDEISDKTKQKLKILDIKLGNKYIIYVCCDGNYYVDGYKWIDRGITGYRFGHIKFPMREQKYFTKNNIKIKKICTSITGYSTFWITDNNELYANGINTLHQLGLDQVKIVEDPTLIPQLSNIVDVASSFAESIALCIIDIFKLCAYLLRSNSVSAPHDIIKIIRSFYGNLSKVHSTKPSVVSTDRNGKWNEIAALKDIEIIKISAGDKHLLFLDINGVVWCCGNNQFGQLGTGYTLSCDYKSIDNTKITTLYAAKSQNLDIPQPIKHFIENDIKITDIACGLYHNLAIDIKGRVYAWGYNGEGQCGNGKTFDVWTPQLIEGLGDDIAIEIKCGLNHSYVKTLECKHYLFGSNENGECIKVNEKIVNKPHLINEWMMTTFNQKSVKSIHCGWRNTIFLLDP